MNYRQFGQTDFHPSALGFGCMRLPKAPDGSIDEAAAIAALRWAADHGVNYFDTAYAYPGSEQVLGRALRDGYRDKVMIADKMPGWLVNEPADLDRLLGESLGRLGTDHIDFYLLHNQHGDSWDKYKALGVQAWLEKQRDAGRIRHIGFSFHDNFELLVRILDDYAGWEFVQIQHNYVCENIQAGNRGVELIGERGLGLVIMEPLFGGNLATPPAKMQAVFDHAGLDPVETALDYLWAKPQVSLVLSGMSDMAQVEHNVAVAENPDYATLSPAQATAIAQAQTAFAESNPIGCTGCRYCQPCPNGVDIPQSFALYNHIYQFEGPKIQLAHTLYGMMAPEHRPDQCVECGECEDKCPQHLPIREWLPKVAAAFAPKK